MAFGAMSPPAPTDRSDSDFGNVRADILSVSPGALIGAGPPPVIPASALAYSRGQSRWRRGAAISAGRCGRSDPPAPWRRARTVSLASPGRRRSAPAPPPVDPRRALAARADISLASPRAASAPAPPPVRSRQRPGGAFCGHSRWRRRGGDRCRHRRRSRSPASALALARTFSLASSRAAISAGTAAAAAIRSPPGPGGSRGRLVGIAEGGDQRRHAAGRSPPALWRARAEVVGVARAAISAGTAPLPVDPRQSALARRTADRHVPRQRRRGKAFPAPSTRTAAAAAGPIPASAPAPGTIQLNRRSGDQRRHRRLPIRARAPGALHGTSQLASPKAAINAGTAAGPIFPSASAALPWIVSLASPRAAISAGTSGDGGPSCDERCGKSRDCT